MTDGIEITNVQAYPVRKKIKGNPLEAFVRVTLNEQFVISGMRVVNGKNGLFVSYPSEYNHKDERHYPLVKPITSEFKEYVSSTVLQHYESEIASVVN